MKQIINRTDLQKYFQIADSCNDAKLKQTIRESLITDLKPLLGRDFFYAVTTTPESHGDILNAKSGTSDNIQYDHVGLKEVLCYFVYARLLMFGDVINNPFGFTRKLSQNNVSEKIDLPTRRALNTNYRDIAFNLWVEVRFYMNLVDYSTYVDCETQPTKAGKFKITKID